MIQQNELSRRKLSEPTITSNFLEHCLFPEWGEYAFFLTAAYSVFQIVRFLKLVTFSPINTDWDDTQLNERALLGQFGLFLQRVDDFAS